MKLRLAIVIFLVFYCLGCSKPTKDEEPPYDYLLCGIVEGWASWTPDGRYIAYGRPARDSTEIFRYGGFSIWMYDTETGNYGPLVGPGIFPKWNPQGTILAFNWQRTIYFYYPEARYVRQVTDPGEIYVFNWSSDGSKLIFGGKYHGHSGCSIVDTLGNLVRNIRDSSEGWRIGGTGVWSRDGNRILVAAGDSLGGNGTLILVDTLGIFIREVLSFEGFDMGEWAPGWSPDESRFAIHAVYVDDESYTLSDLRIYDMQGQLERIIGAGGAAQWSPDGSQIVFQQGTWMAPSPNPMLEPDCARVTVWICNDDGSDSRELLGWPQPESDSTMFGGGYNWLNPSPQ